MIRFHIDSLLSQTTHRVNTIPANKWAWYQEWHELLFLHWQVEPDLLKEIIPKATELDTIDGKAWVSLVAFTMKNIRPRMLPYFPPFSNFHEVNLRTYVKHSDKAGVYFLSIEAEKYISTLLSKRLSGLPYEKAILKCSGETEHCYRVHNDRTGNQMDAVYTIREAISEKTVLDKWLTERYYTFDERKGKCYSYSIHHKEWELTDVTLNNIKLFYKSGGIMLNESNIDLVHYSDGVQVVAWPQEVIQ